VSAARDEILSRIRTALRDVPAGETPADVAVARDYRHVDDRPVTELVELLSDRLHDYGAEVRRTSAADAGRAVGDACARMGLARIVVSPGLPAQWRPAPDGAAAGPEVLSDDDLTARELDDIDGAVTGCASAIAETGTLVLDGQPLSGRRVITLVPDHHICLVGTEQIVGQVPEAISALTDAVTRTRAPVTLVSGASATSDIELSRVEGVHGPRHLLVLIVEP
jgi:L-lactate dehydrogenase complex protein LldG